MGSAKVLEEHLHVGTRLLVSAKTASGLVQITGKVVELTRLHFRIRAGSPVDASALSPQQRVKVRFADARGTIPLECRFLRVDKKRPTDVVLSVPEGDWIVNRRAFARAPLAFPVTIVRHSGQEVRGRTVDISGGGALIEVDTPLMLGEEFTLRVIAEDGDPLEFGARVVREASAEEAEKFGVQFVKATTRAQNRVCKLVIVSQFEQRRAELRELTGRSESR